MNCSSVIKKVGVFGGIFDPIHKGHIAVARAVRDELKLDQILMVVNNDQWMRNDPVLASPDDRYKMVKLALNGERDIEVSDVDIVRGGPTYTINTLVDLQKALGSMVKLHLIVGSDSAMSMHIWKNSEKIPELATIVTVGRPGEVFDTELLDNFHPAKRAVYVVGPMLNVSATQIRNLKQSNHSIKNLVTESVDNYIKTQKLYQ